MWKNQLPSLAKTIQSCKGVILFLDAIEERRDLSLQEWNFRELVQTQLQTLLNQQKIYWKQRGTINWVKFGHECTESFHANASIKHRRNFITMLQSPDNIEIYDHEAKANLIWEAFKERLGTTEFSHMYIELDSLFKR